MDYHLKKKKSEMEGLMERFVRTNKEHQELMNENIELCSKIRKKKKADVKKIKREQKNRFKKRVKDFKQTILQKSTIGSHGETIVPKSVLEEFVQGSQVKVAEKNESNFFSKLKNSVMIFGGNSPEKKITPRSVRSKKELKKVVPTQKGKVRKRKSHARNKSPLLQKKAFRSKKEIRGKSHKKKLFVKNVSDTSFDNSDVSTKEKIKTKKKTVRVTSKRFSHESDNKIRIGKKLSPSKLIHIIALTLFLDSVNRLKYSFYLKSLKKSI